MHISTENQQLSHQITNVMNTFVASNHYCFKKHEETGNETQL